MAKLNRHGLNIVGIKAASSDTRDFGYPSSVINCIRYNRETGKVYVAWETPSSFICRDADCPTIEVCRSTHHMTMQEIADAICWAVTGNHELRGNWDSPVERIN